MRILILFFISSLLGANAFAADTFPAQPRLPAPEPARPIVVPGKNKNISASRPTPIAKEQDRDPLADPDTQSKPIVAPVKSPDNQTEESPSRENWWTRQRSNPDALFWVGGKVGLDGHERGTGFMEQAHLRLKFGRCGIIGTYTAQETTIWDPAEVHTTLAGLGATCTLVTFGRRTWFFRGAHFSASLLAQYGRTKVRVYDGGSSYAGRRQLFYDEQSAFGGNANFDFYFPLVFGFWVNWGIGYQKMNYNYAIPNNVNPRPYIPNELGEIHTGFSYGI